MTPSDAVDEVLEILERPDLESIAYKRFYSSLQSAHKISKYRRDLYTAYITNPSIFNTKVIYTIDDVTPRLREIRSVQLYTGYSEPTAGNIIPDPDTLVFLNGNGFVDIADRLEARDYYGYKFPYTYSASGGTGTLVGVDASSTLVQITYLGFPTWLRDPVTEEYSTDSWILREFPQIVQAFLRQHLTTVIDSESLRSAALTELAFQREEFAQTYYKDNIGE